MTLNQRLSDRCYTYFFKNNIYSVVKKLAVSYFLRGWWGGTIFFFVNYSKHILETETFKNESVCCYKIWKSQTKHRLC